MSTITVDLEYDAIKIRFNGALHLCIKRSKLLGVQSWTYGDNNYSIEYSMEGKDILTEYDEKEKWLLILKKLDELL